MEVNLTGINYDGEEFLVPISLLEDKDVFDHVMSHDTWLGVLTDEERENVVGYLPATMTDTEKQDIIRMLFDRETFSFGNPLDQTFKKLSSGRYSSEIEPLYNELGKLKYELYKQNMKQYHIRLLEDLLLSRRRLIQSAFETGGIDNIHTASEGGKRDDFRQRRKRRNQPKTVLKRAEEKYRKILNDCRQTCDLSSNCDSSDDASDNDSDEFCVLNEKEYLKILKDHKKKRRMKVFSPELDTRGITMASVIGVQPSSTQPGSNEKDSLQSNKHHSAPVESNKKSTAHSSSSSATSRKANYVPQAIKMREKQKWDGLFEGKGCIYEVYKDAEKLKVDKADPIILDAPLPSGEFTSFFALLKRAFDSLNDRKGDVNKVTEVVQVYLDSPECQSCEWVSEQPSWGDLVLSSLCYLGGEVGAVSTFDPLPHFYPIIEFRDRIDHWKWLGNKRDSDIELMVLCNHWKNNLHRALTVVDYTDYSPLPSLVPSSSIVKASKSYEVDKFQQLERQRYSIPQKAFTYLVHGYEAAVGPVKGVKGGTAKREHGSRAREHFLLKSERPNCVTILSLVRDACSRLPNGEGTRLDICILLKDSEFVADNVTDSQLNNAVSGALDRLHYEKDPCVRYISSKKMWIYLHRNRTEEEFEHISWACEAANRNKKLIMSRAKLTPKIMLRDSSGHMTDVSPQPGSAPTSTGYSRSKASPKIPRSPKRSQKGASGKISKTPKPKRGSAKKGISSSQGKLKPPALSIAASAGGSAVDSDVEQHRSELPMLSTTQPSDDDNVTDPSSSEESQTNFTNFSGSYVKKYGLSEGPTNTTPPQWLMTAEDSDSNASE